MSSVLLTDGLIIAVDHVRLVVGGRGAYLEIDDRQIVKHNIEIEPGQEYRLTPAWRQKAYYEWWRAKTTHAKLYKQLRPVTYADYRIGYWYIDPQLLMPQSWRKTL